jgi:predicted RNA-binding Zn-ribbon protein involved in translation (DUF1610 family)
MIRIREPVTKPVTKPVTVTKSVTTFVCPVCGHRKPLSAAERQRKRRVRLAETVGADG